MGLGVDADGSSRCGDQPLVQNLRRDLVADFGEPGTQSGRGEPVDLGLVLTPFILCPLAAALLISIGVGGLRTGSYAAGFIGAGIIVASAVAFYRIALRMCVLLYGDSVIIRNPVRTYRFMRSEVVDAYPYYDGVKIVLSSGRCVTAVAVPRWNLSLVLNRRGRADELAQLLNEPTT